MATQNPSGWTAIRRSQSQGFIFASILIFALSVLAIISKAFGVDGWKHATGIWQFEIANLPEVDEDWSPAPHILYLEQSGPFLNIPSNALVFVSASIGILVALFTMNNTFHVATHGPRTGRFARLAHHIIYPLFTTFTLAVFVYITAVHYTSARFKPEKPHKLAFGQECTGLCWVGGVLYRYRSPQNKPFDIETFTCDLYNTKFLEDPENRLQRICVGETGGRWLLLPLGLAMLVLALLMESDRRGARRFTENRVATDGESGFELQGNRKVSQRGEEYIHPADRALGRGWA